MSSTRAPAIFVSHGSPTTVFDDDDYTRALRRFGEQIPKPKAIAIVSAHGQAPGPSLVIGANALPELWYDFRGFQPELYHYQYPVKGDPALAIQISTRLAQKGLKAGIEPHNRLDHGVWVPLSLMFPKADIPVVEIAIPATDPANALYQAGQALAPLRSEGVMIVGSGGATHNLGRLRWQEKYGTAEPKMKAFEDWLLSALRENRVEELLHYEKQPNGELAHPTWEHYHPLLFTLGARETSDAMNILYEGFEYSTLSMLSFSFQ